MDNPDEEHIFEDELMQIATAAIASFQVLKQAAEDKFANKGPIRRLFSFLQDIIIDPISETRKWLVQKLPSHQEQ